MARRVTSLATLGALIRSNTDRLSRSFRRPALVLNTSGFDLSVLPEPILSGEAARGDEITSGRFRYNGQVIDVGTSGDPWTIALPSVAFAKKIHGFDWLQDMAAAGAPTTGPKARELISRWITIYGKWNAFSWSPDMLTERMFNWLTTAPRLFAVDDENQAERRQSALKQIKYLRKTAARVTPGSMEIKAQIVLALGGAAFGDTNMIDRAIDQIEDLLELQVLGDGGHISRDPSAVLHMTHWLILLKSCLDKASIPPSKGVRRALDRMAPALSFFTHADGELGAFNGSGHMPRKAISDLIRKSGVKAKAFSYMPHSGYQRIEREGLVALIDSGETPDRPYDLRAHLAPLAMEISSKAGKIFVNCGWSDHQPEQWHTLVRQTAAHSTLILDDCSAGSILETGLRHRLFGAAVKTGIEEVHVSRKELEGAIWMDGMHHGYLTDTGLAHRRRIFMEKGGRELRGEDTLFVPAGHSPKYSGAHFPFAIRFHIAPGIKVTLARNGQSALLIQGNREGWRFRSSGRKLVIEDSISLSKGRAPQKTQQLVIYGNALSDNDGEDRSNRIMWMLSHLSEEEQS